MSIGNSVTFIGRLVREPEIKHINDMAIANFSLARDRMKSSNQTDKKTDFIDFTAFSKNAEFLSKYFTKGQRVGVAGHLQVNEWKDKEGVNRKTVNVIVDNFEFIEGINSSYKTDTKNGLDIKTNNDSFIEVTEEDADDLPF